VRLSDVRIYSNLGEDEPAVDIFASEVELVRSEINGWTGWEDDAGASGSAGVLIDGGSRVRISLCEVEGGSGADVFNGGWGGFDPGDGSPAVHVRGSSEVSITGDGTQVLQGGHCGYFGDEPGYGSSAVFAEGSSTVRVSGVLAQGGYGGWGWSPGLSSTSDSTIEQPHTADPTLEILGDPVPGHTLTMRVTGPPGGNVRYLLGRIPEINYRGGLGPDLLVEIRVVNPGVIPPSGVRDYNFVLPGNLPEGMYFLGQAKIVYQGSTYRTASQVVLVR